MNKSYIFVPIGAALLIALYYPMSEWLSVSPLGTRFFLGFRTLFLLATLLLLAGASAFGFVAYFVKGRRKLAIALHVFVLLTIWLSLVGFDLIKEIHYSAFLRLGERLEALISAIHRYEDERGNPPASLADLEQNYSGFILDRMLGKWAYYSS